MNACVHLATCICLVLQSAAGLGMGALCGHSIASPAPVRFENSNVYWYIYMLELVYIYAYMLE